MAFQFNNRPLILSPAYNPLIYNVEASNYTDVNFKFGMLLSAGTSSLTDLGSYTKQATNNQYQWWEPSRIVQTQLSYTFPTNQTRLHTDGDNNIAYIRAKFSANTATTLTYNSYVFNGYVDRNEGYNNDIYDYVPTSASTRAKFLSNYNTRKVFTNDRGTMSMFTGSFSSSTSGVSSHNKYVRIKTYVNNSLNSVYHMYNHAWKDVPFFETAVTTKRVTFPAYPYSLNNSTGFRFYDNDFGPSGLSGGTVGFRFTTAIPDVVSVGDRIQIAQDGGYTNPSYNGITTIIWISPDRLALDTAKGWGVSTPPEPGYIYAIDKASVYSANTTSLPISGTSSTVGELTIHFDTSAGFDAFTIPYGTLIHLHGFANSNYNVTVTATTATTSSRLLIPTIPFSTNQSGYTVVSSRMVNGPIIDSAHNKYTLNMVAQPDYTFASTSAVTGVTMFDFTGTPYTFNLEHTCAKNDDLFISWLNKMGAFDYQNFRLRRDSIVNYERASYTKRLGGNTGQYSYGQSDFEFNNFNGSQQLTYSYNTDWLSDVDSQRILELAGSNVIFAYLNGVWTPIVCEITDIQYQNRQNNGLVQYTLEFKATYKTYSQRN